MQLQQNQIDQILDLARQGHSLSQIQAKTGRCASAIHHACDRYRVELQKQPTYNQWSQDQIDLCLRLYDAGLTENEIQHQMGVTHKSTKKYLRAAGRPSRPRGQQGAANHYWRGGRQVDKHGYILVYSPDHPHRDSANRVREHRLVLERHLGRYLLPEEVVDHINGDTSDNRVENLRLFPNNAAHLRATLKGRVPKWTEDGQAKILAAGRAHRLRRTLSRSTLGVLQLQGPHVHRCTAGTCPLYEIGRAAKLERQRSRCRAWRRRGRTHQPSTAPLPT